MISNSNSIPNFETFQSGKLILVYFPSNPYFIWNFLSKGRPFFDRIDLIPFEKFLNKSTRILFLWAGPKATGPSPPPPRPSRPFPSHIPAPKDLPGHATRQPPPPPHLRPTGVRPPPLAKSLPGPPPPSLSPPRGALIRAPILSHFPSLLQLEAAKRTPLVYFCMSPRHSTLPCPLPVPIVRTPPPEPPSIIRTSSQCRRDRPNSVSIAIPAFDLQLVGTSPPPLTLLIVGTCFGHQRPPYDFPRRQAPPRRDGIHRFSVTVSPR
jgi:hypothetical protein